MDCVGGSGKPSPRTAILAGQGTVPEDTPCATRVTSPPAPQVSFRGGEPEHRRRPPRQGRPRERETGNYGACGVSSGNRWRKTYLLILVTGCSYGRLPSGNGNVTSPNGDMAP